MNISLSKKDNGYHLATFELVNEVNADAEQVFATLEELGAFLDSASTVEKAETENAIALEIQEAAPDTALAQEAPVESPEEVPEVTPETVETPVEVQTEEAEVPTDTPTEDTNV